MSRFGVYHGRGTIRANTTRRLRNATLNSTQVTSRDAGAQQVGSDSVMLGVASFDGRLASTILRDFPGKQIPLGAVSSS